eukprot:9128969-Lingulodinium_polyedra.AAC.1
MLESGLTPTRKRFGAMIQLIMSEIKLERLTVKGNIGPPKSRRDGSTPPAEPTEHSGAASDTSSTAPTQPKPWPIPPIRQKR